MPLLPIPEPPLKLCGAPIIGAPLGRGVFHFVKPLDYIIRAERKTHRTEKDCMKHRLSFSFIYFPIKSKRYLWNISEEHRPTDIIS